jgi:cyclophilin family peptidyl-prolyl cis-trans isomerase
MESLGAGLGPSIKFPFPVFRNLMMHIRIGLVLALMFLVLPISGLPAEPADPPPKPGPKKAEFDRVLAKWKDLLTELAGLQINYRKAEEGERAEIRKKWTPLIEKGDVLEPKLIAAAEQAFVEAPNADKQVTDLLVDVLVGHVQTGPLKVQTDDYDQAYRLAELLVDNGCADERIYNLFGIAAFALSDFDTAEKYLELAKKKKLPIGSGREPVDGLVNNFLADPAHYKKAWAKEQQIRQAEAKADDLPRVLLKTNKGDIELELFENEAPNTVANFISLVEKKYYNGLTFHRVLPGFMAQGGCPTGDGMGGPGYRIPCECHPPHKFRLHFRGSLSMAHAGRDTGGSQFFLTFLPTSLLDGRHTAFGRVIKGLDVLHKIQRRDPQQPNPPEPDKIVEAKVLRKRDHDYAPSTFPE